MMGSKNATIRVNPQQLSRNHDYGNENRLPFETSNSKVWALKQKQISANLGNDYYLAKFASKEEKQCVVRLIDNHILAVREQQHNFDPNKTRIKREAVVRFCILCTNTKTNPHKTID